MSLQWESIEGKYLYTTDDQCFRIEYITDYNLIKGSKELLYFFSSDIEKSNGYFPGQPWEIVTKERLVLPTIVAEGTINSRIITDKEFIERCYLLNYFYAGQSYHFGCNSDWMKDPDHGLKLARLTSTASSKKIQSRIGSIE